MHGRVTSRACQNLFQLRKHLLPSGIGAAERLPLIRPEMAGLTGAGNFWLIAVARVREGISDRKSVV